MRQSRSLTWLTYVSIMTVRVQALSSNKNMHSSGSSRSTCRGQNTSSHNEQENKQLEAKHKVMEIQLIKAKKEAMKVKALLMRPMTGIVKLKKRKNLEEDLELESLKEL